MSIEDKVKGMLAERLDIEAGDIKLESRFVNDLGADSLDIVELLMKLEDEFDLEISDEEAEQITTVKDAVDYITERM
ncbi:MAG: acyl carrier protein [Desulfosudaceae bacterium]